jgi:hypothetical protein
MKLLRQFLKDALGALWRTVTERPHLLPDLVEFSAS